MDVPHNVSSCSHIAFCGLGLLDVHDGGKEEGFAMLASKVPRNDFVEISKMGLAFLVDASQVSLSITCQAMCSLPYIRKSYRSSDKRCRSAPSPPLLIASFTLSCSCDSVLVRVSNALRSVRARIPLSTPLTASGSCAGTYSFLSCAVLSQLVSK